MKKEKEHRSYTKDELDTLNRLNNMPSGNNEPVGYVGILGYHNLSWTECQIDDIQEKSTIGDYGRSGSKVSVLLDLIYYANLNENEMSQYCEELQGKLAIENNHVGKKYVINYGKYFGCSELDVLLKIISYAVNKDKINFDSLLKKGIENRECTYFNKGEKVILLEINDEIYVRIQREEDQESYWTIITAID